MIRKQLVVMAYGIGLAALVSVPAFAQAAQPPAAKPASASSTNHAGKAMKYNAKTEVTVSGTIEEIKPGSSMGSSSVSESVMLKTETGDIHVDLAPADYWNKNGFALTKGASIEVTGSKAQSGNSTVVLARTVKEGEKSVSLRNAEGVPAWQHQAKAK
jgi:hypothetical protein